MIDVVLYRKDEGFRDRVRIRNIDRLILDDTCLVWIDVTAPTHKEMERLRAELRLPPLVIEDLAQRNERARVVQWPGMYSIVFFAVKMEEGTGRVQLQQINLVIAAHFVLTVHEHPIPEVEEVIRRWKTHGRDLPLDVGFPVYALLDTLIDGYYPCLDQIAERAEALEDDIFENRAEGASEALFDLKKDLLLFRRVVAPERDVVNVLLRREQPVFRDASGIYFQDLYDHLVRIMDTLDTYRDLLSTAMDTYLTIVSNRFAENSLKVSESANRLNQTMQVLASWSIILMSMSLVAGIYGMNFKVMPELNLPYGYHAALVAMLVIGGTLVAYFKRKRWL